MPLKNRTIEELLDMEEELHMSSNEEEDGSLQRLFSLYMRNCTEELPLIKTD